MSEQRSVSPPPSRIGPTEPDDTMVICPVCTSQFRAIPLDVQRVLAFLIARAEGRSDEETNVVEPLGPRHPCHKCKRTFLTLEVWGDHIQTCDGT